MKVSELKLGQSVEIDGKTYQYKGVQKIKKPGCKVQKIVFESNQGDRYDYKYYDLPTGSKQLTVTKDKIELK